VFERFRQADSSTKRVHGGIGLGLAIVRHLVELHGGTVSAESKGSGKGAAFTVELPVRAMRGGAVPELARKDRGTRGTGSRPALSGVHVLVVEDDQDARYLIEDTLRHYGARVTSVASVREALAAIETSRPDVMVSDIAMPEQDGFDLIRAVRQLPGPGRVI